MKSFEEVVSEIETAGFVVNNLFKRTEGFWMGNVRSKDSKLYEYAIADTAQQSLTEALSNALARFPGAQKSKEFMALPGQKVPNWETYQPKPAAQDDLLGLEDGAAREIAEAACAVTEIDDLLG